MPTAVAQSTLTGPAAAWSSVTANCAWTVPAFPSVTVRSPIEICGGAAVTVNVCGADTPVLPALSDCSACAVYVPAASAVVPLTVQAPDTASTVSVCTGVPVACVPA